MYIKNNIIKSGIYKHYKGALYEVLYTAKHTETLEELIVYKAIYGDYAIWIRPKKIFQEMITVPNVKIIPRFEYLKDF